jgi:hypothetical protein
MAEIDAGRRALRHSWMRFSPGLAWGAMIRLEEGG